MRMTGITHYNLIKLQKIESDIDSIRVDYINKVEELSSKDHASIPNFLKQMFSESNAFRNKVYSKLNEGENILSSNFRESSLSKNKQLKTIINKEYVETKQSFIKEDGYLKKRISEILNAKKS